MVFVGGDRAANSFHAIRSGGVRNFVVRARRLRRPSNFVKLCVEEVRLEAGKHGDNVRRVGVIAHVVVIRIKMRPRGT